MKTATFKCLKLILLLMLIFGIQSAISQRKHSISLISNPFIYKLGNLESQYTSVNNDFVKANYFNKPGFEFGFQYSLNLKNRFSYFVGFTWLNQRHKANYILFGPNEQFESLILNFHEIQLTENLIGIRMGSQFEINERLSLGLGVSFYAPLEIKSNMSTEKIHYTRSGYNLYNTPDSSYSELSFRLENKIQKRYGNGLIIPDIYFDYEMAKNFTLSLGCRFKLWTNQNDWILKYEVNGFTKPSSSGNEQLLFSSRIKSEGLYTYLGLKYTLPLSKIKR